MILRKPYAFLIKHFRLIHTVLSICMIYLLYKSYTIYKFLNDFVSSGSLTIDYNTTDKLFNLYMFLIPWIVIVIIVILLVVMFRKNKPKGFYFINIIIYASTIGIYNYLYNTISYMQVNIIASKDAKLAMDIAFIVTIAQLIGTIISIIRSLGLDLKKFDFGKDLLELDIADEDNEEFEVSVNIDADSIKRKFKKKLRYAKYTYVENRTIINSAIFIIIATIGFIVYLNMSVYNVHYDEGQMFSTTDYALSINKSYITTKDSKGNNIVDKDKALLVLDINVKNYGNTDKINLAKSEVKLNDEIYYPTTKYSNSLMDLGESYINQNLDLNLERYILTYEIPMEQVNKKIYFRYLNGFNAKSSSLKPTYIRVKLSPINLDSKVTSTNISLNEIVIMNDKTLGNTSVTINNLEVKKEFINDYNFCLTRNDCYKSIEYIKPTLNTNYDKALLKIEGTITLDEKKNTTSLKNLYSIINYFGELEYIKDGIINKISSFIKVLPKRYQQDNVYYLEINEDVLDADAAYFTIKIRNYEYKFTIFAKDVNE